MFKIRDKTNNEWIREVPWMPGNLKSGVHTVSKGTGKIFKRKSDVSSHIAHNLDFYTHHAQRFEVVEFKMVEDGCTGVDGFLESKKTRDQDKADRKLVLEARQKQYQIDKLQAELAKLQGK